MKVRFWGTRGSIPSPGAGTVRYGGNTSCVEVRSAAGTLVVLDCGTGARLLGQALLGSGQRPLRGHILISHTHWDHIQGLPFFAPLFIAGNQWDIYAPHGFEQSLRETLAGQMQYAFFPVTLDQLGAEIRFHELVEGVFQVGEVSVRAQYLNHTALTLGYRLEADSVAVVYACDHEPHSRRAGMGAGTIGALDRRHVEFLAGADLVIHDAQYTVEEYRQKKGWGHGTPEYALDVARAAGAARLAVTHHDPFRDDAAVDRIVETLRARAGPGAPAIDVFGAAEGQVLELEGAADKAYERPTDEVSAVAPSRSALAEHRVLLGVADPETASLLLEAAQGDAVRVALATNGDAVLRKARAERPSLLLLEHNPPAMDALAVCESLRRAESRSDLPVMIVTSREEDAAQGMPGVDWLVRPFTIAYARSRVRAALLRTACRWVRAPAPPDEERRLGALRELRLLDTPPEERFDRLTRLAAALFDVPIALVSLVDRDRQWFKSSVGLEERETPREAAFCAHAILGREPLIVPDALRDSRFADNPLVTGEPRVRFYAGQPLTLPDGSRVGTLCLVDRRPRELDDAGKRLLGDLGYLVERELTATPDIKAAA